MGLTVYPQKTKVTGEDGGPVSIASGDGPSIDAFGRLRVSAPITLFDSKQLYDSQPLFFDDQETSGSGTSTAHSTAEAATTISVGNTTAGTRVRQTFMRFNYQPGKSQLIFVTFGEFDTDTGITKRVGYFDDNNGLFFESEEGTVNVVRRTSVSGSPVDNEVAQASWNIDVMDGTGPSGVTLDFTKTAIGIIDFEFLGVGRARMGWVVDGLIYYCHEFLNANVLATVYMSTPNLPIRYEIANDGNGAADDFMHICSTVISEGGQENTGVLRYKSTAGTHVAAASANTIYAVVGLRLKSTALGASINIENISVMNQTTVDIEWMLLLNPTVAGTPTFADETNSAVQSVAGAAANTVTNGTYIDGGFIKSGNNSGSGRYGAVNALRLGAAIDGTRDTLYLCARPLSANAEIEGSITWRELS